MNMGLTKNNLTTLGIGNMGKKDLPDIYAQAQSII